ncbi:MAG: cytochrome c oxidase subunit 3 [Ilumatobacteraceae bacterium]
MLALPSAPAPAARRQLFVGTALVCAAGATMLGGMLAVWLRFRDEARAAGTAWLPKGITVPEVASNIMLFSFIAIVVFAQWAVYAARRGDKQHTAMALGLTALIGLAVINAQAAVYTQMALPIRSDVDVNGYGVMFYALTGTFVLFLIGGIVFSLVTAFRYLGGRTTEREIVTAHALYWNFVTAAFCMLWFVVYVTK